MKVLFLDIDGVLNTTSTELPIWGYEQELVDNLNYVIKKTGAKIVLSSTWRIIEEARNFITNEMGIDFMDVTPTKFSSCIRGHEIQLWLDNNPEITNFVIVDDDNDMGKLLPYLVKTDDDYGLTKSIANKIIKKLNRRV